MFSLLKPALVLALTTISLTLAAVSTSSSQYLETRRSDSGGLGQNEWITQVAAAPNGKEVISAGVDGRVVYWHAATGKNTAETRLSGIILTLAISKGGERLAVGNSLGTVYVIDLSTRSIKTQFQLEKQLVTATAWSEDGKFVAAGGSDGIVRVWSVESGAAASEMRIGQGRVTFIGFSNNTLIAGLTGNNEGTIELWDWRQKRRVRTLDSFSSALRAASFSPDGKELAVAGHDPASLLMMLPAAGGAVEISLRLLPDSDEPVPIAVFDLESESKPSVFMAETGARALAYSPDGSILATGGPKGVLLFSRAGKAYTEVGRIDSRTAIDAIAFSPDSRRLFVARERVPLVGVGDRGLEKLFDPFFQNIAMVIREASKPSFSMNLANATRSLTGGSSLETWAVAPRSGPSDTRTWEAIRLAFADKGSEAKAALQKVISDYPRYAEAQRVYVVLFESNDAQRAVALLEAAVKSDPSCGTCLRTLGDIQSNVGNNADAANSYERALKLRSEYGLIEDRLSEIYMRLGMETAGRGNTAANMKSALDWIAKAQKLRPANPRVYSNMGAVHYFRADFQNAILNNLLAQKLRPDLARVYYNLGHAYRANGDKSLAIEAYQRYVELGEKGEEPRVERARQILKELTGN